MLENVFWRGHACIQIKGSRNLYVDPFQLTEKDSADIVLITHDHDDHLSPADLKKIVNPETEIVLPEQYAHQIEQGRVHGIAIGNTLTLQDIQIQAVPAYNLKKQFHPEERNNVGYLFKIDGCTYYHAGDTDLISEMESIQTDIAFLPVGGTYTMNAEEAAKAADIIQLKIAVPIHWGAIVGGKSDAELFKALCHSSVQILKKI